MRRCLLVSLLVAAKLACASVTDPSYDPRAGAPGPDWYAGDEVLHLVMLDGYESQNAVCMDGSPGGYYLSRGTDSSLWVVFLEGGYWCLGEDSCTGRRESEPAQASSQGWSNATVVGGIFSRDPAQNPWAAANFVYLRYCSSDAWMGDGTAFGYQFRGQAIIQATLTDVMAREGLGAGARLLFGGCSAGGRGAMANLENVAARMSALGVIVSGVLDSSLWLDVTPSVPDALGGSLLQQCEMVYGFANTTGVIPPACAAAYPSTPWKCMMGEYRMPFETTPYFQNQENLDDFQVDYNCGSTSATDAAGETLTTVTATEAPCVDAFQAKMLGVTAALPTARQTGSALFSSSCSLHCISTGPDWWTITVDGHSMASSMAAWYFGTSPPLKVVSSCVGYACADACLPYEEANPPGDFGASAPKNNKPLTTAALGGAMGGVGAGQMGV